MRCRAIRITGTVSWSSAALSDEGDRESQAAGRDRQAGVEGTDLQSQIAELEAKLTETIVQVSADQEVPAPTRSQRKTWSLVAYPIAPAAEETRPWQPRPTS